MDNFTLKRIESLRRSMISAFEKLEKAGKLRDNGEQTNGSSRPNWQILLLISAYRFQVKPKIGKSNFQLSVCFVRPRSKPVALAIEHLLLFRSYFGKHICMKASELTAEVEYIVKQIINKYRPLKIILFGSAARGEYEQVNDLDFIIIKEDVPKEGLARMRELDDMIDRNMAADMLVYRPEEFDERLKMGDPFIEEIMKEGQVLYGWSTPDKGMDW